MENNTETYCYLLSEENKDKCKEQCDMCKEYDYLINVELSELDNKINGYWKVEDAVKTFMDFINEEINEVANSTENPEVFKNGAQWIIDKLKQYGMDMEKDSLDL